MNNQQAEQKFDKLVSYKEDLEIAKQNNETDAIKVFERKIQDLEFGFNTLNVGQRNSNTISNFSEKILCEKNKKNQKKQLRRFLESESKFGLITAPTQVGKTMAIEDFIKDCLKQKIPVVLSCDNKKDQLDQIYSRIKKGLCGRDISLLSDSDIDKFSDSLEKNERSVVFCLDNASQIKKLKKEIKCLKGSGAIIPKIVFIHDEGDVITKHKDFNKDDEKAASSHKAWVEVDEFINKEMPESDLKRIFVSATPENCMVRYSIKPEYVIQLEITQNYSGFDNIETEILEDDYQIKEILEREVNDIKTNGENGVILLITERKITNQADLLEEFSELVCVKNTYNGDGISTTIPSELFIKNIEEFKRNNKCIKTKITRGILNIKNMAISDFYEICRASGEKVVITIGKDLMTRGISYVSTRKEGVLDTLAATVMVYKPGVSMHNVGICQTIGRITGVARPDLKRKLIAPVDVIQNYINYNKNQRQLFKAIDLCDEDSVKMIIEKIELENKLSRPVDRKNTGINDKFMYKKDDSKITGYDSNIIMKWWVDDTISGKILRFIYNNNVVNKQEFLKYTKSIGTRDAIGWWDQLGNSVYKNYYTRSNDIVSLKQITIDDIERL